jgi:hypothetical protein
LADPLQDESQLYSTDAPSNNAIADEHCRQSNIDNEHSTMTIASEEMQNSSQHICWFTFWRGVNSF